MRAAGRSAGRAGAAGSTPATGKVRERVSVGATSRFATPAISGARLFMPTLTGVTIVDTAG